jgi:hypothetical protein
VPIDVVYSDLATNFDTSYHNLEVVPMMMVRNPNGDPNETGLKKLRELICQRVRLIEPKLEKTLEGKVKGLDLPAVFDSPETLKQLCLMSGGHMRDLMKLIQSAIEQVDQLPITSKAVVRFVEWGSALCRMALCCYVLCQVETGKLKRNPVTQRMIGLQRRFEKSHNPSR